MLGNCEQRLDSTLSDTRRAIIFLHPEWSISDAVQASTRRPRTSPPGAEALPTAIRLPFVTSPSPREDISRPGLSRFPKSGLPRKQFIFILWEGGEGRTLKGVPAVRSDVLSLYIAAAWWCAADVRRTRTGRAALSTMRALRRGDDTKTVESVDDALSYRVPS